MMEHKQSLDTQTSTGFSHGQNSDTDAFLQVNEGRVSSHMYCLCIYVYKHTHTSRRDAFFEGIGLTEHEKKQYNILFKFILLSYSASSSPSSPFSLPNCPLFQIHCHSVSLQKRQASQRCQLSNTATPKSPYQSRKIKHNRRKRVPQTRKSAKDNCTANVWSSTRNPRWTTKTQFHRTYCRSMQASRWLLRSLWAPMSPPELILWAVFSWHPWLIWFLPSSLLLFTRIPKLCLRFHYESASVHINCQRKPLWRQLIYVAEYHWKSSLISYLYFLPVLHSSLGRCYFASLGLWINSYPLTNSYYQFISE